MMNRTANIQVHNGMTLSSSFFFTMARFFAGLFFVGFFGRKRSCLVLT